MEWLFLIPFILIFCIIIPVLIWALIKEYKDRKNDEER